MLLFEGSCNRGFDWVVLGPDADRLDNYGLFDLPLNYLVISHKIRENHSFINRKSIEIWPMRRSIMSVKTTLTSLVIFKQNIILNLSLADIRHDFTFKKEYLEPCTEFIEENGGQDNNIFLHVRRGNPNVTEEEREMVLPDGARVSSYL